MSLRDQILATTPRLQSERVTIPEWGGVVLDVVEMTAAERDAFEVAHIRDNRRHFRARLVCVCCRSDGATVFQEADIPKLAAYPPRTLDPIVSAAIRVNRMQDDRAEFERGNAGADGGA